MLKKITVAVLVTAGLAFNAHAVSNNKEYVDFFNKYEALNKAYDSALADLYSDNAKAVITTIEPDGTETKITVPGKKLKSILKDTMDYSRQMGYQDQYSNIAIIPVNDAVKITADRYSLTDCVTDHSFYLLVKKADDGKLYIMEEVSEEPLESKCEKGFKEDVALQIALIAKVTNQQLPMKIDGDTLFERVGAEDKELTYYYTLVNYTAAEANKEHAREVLQPRLIARTCKTAEMKKLLDNGATFSWKYSSKDSLPLLKVTVDAESCKKVN